MLIQIEYMGKTYLCTMMPDWADMIEELYGGGAISSKSTSAPQPSTKNSLIKCPSRRGIVWE